MAILRPVRSAVLALLAAASLVAAGCAARAGALPRLFGASASESGRGFSETPIRQGLVAFLITALLFTCAATPANNDGGPTPEKLFAEAFAKLRSYPVAPYAIYSTFWNISQTDTASGGQTVSYTAVHRYAVRMADGVENIMLKRSEGHLPTAAMGHQFVGPFAWSLLGSRRSQGASPMSPDLESGLRVIATVAAVAKPPYSITIAGIETVDGHEAYHLKLRPESDPQRHNLRDLWVDRETFDLREAHYVGSYTPDNIEPSSPSDISVYFEPVGQYWIAMRDVWTFREFDKGIYNLSDAKITSIAFLRSLPDWIFDANAYEKHRAAKEPDCLRIILDAGSGSCDDGANANPAPAATP